MIERADMTQPGARLELVIDTQHLPATRTKAGKRSPQLPRKNDYFRIVKPRGPGAARLIVSEIGKAHRLAMSQAAVRAGLFCSKSKPLIASGLWALRLKVWAPRKRGELEDGLPVPLIDSDACLSPVKDALMHAGIIDDDWRIETDSTRREYRKGAPGYAVTLLRLTAGEWDPLLQGCRWHKRAPW